MRDWWIRVKAFFGLLPEPDLTPGRWFNEYRQFWAAVNDVPVEWAETHMRAGIVDATNGWVWATDSPETDRYFFESRGFAFPKRWVTYSSLESYEGVPGEYLMLDI